MVRPSRRLGRRAGETPPRRHPVRGLGWLLVVDPDAIDHEQKERGRQGTEEMGPLLEGKKVAMPVTINNNGTGRDETRRDHFSAT